MNKESEIVYKEIQDTLNKDLQEKMELIIDLFNQLETDDMLITKNLVEINFRELVLDRLNEIYNHKFNIEAKEALVKVIDLVKKYELDIHAEKGIEVKLLSKSSKNKTKPTKMEPKYRNPENDKQTWAGHGRKPDWLNEQINSGKELDDFLIEQSNK